MNFLISDLKQKCINCSPDEKVSLTFLNVCAYNNCKTQNFPVIVVKFQDGRELKLSYFIDHLGRVYNTYSEFLKDNTLDDWLIAVPNLRKVMMEETESENEQLRNNPFRGPNWTE